MRTDLLPEELELLEGSGRCKACAHLDVLHNDHCCEFCMVPGCECWFGSVTRERKTLADLLAQPSLGDIMRANPRVDYED